MSLHIVTQKNKELVYELAYDAQSKKDISEYLGISVTTFNQHYSKEYIRGNVDAKRARISKIREQGDDGNLIANITLAKFLGHHEAKPEVEQEEQPKIIEHRIVKIDHNNYKDIDLGVISDVEYSKIENDDGHR